MPSHPGLWVGAPLPTRWLGNSLVPGKVRCGANEGKGMLSSDFPVTIRPRSNPTVYIASSDGPGETEFHIFNYPVSWGEEESSPLPFPLHVLEPHCCLAWALPCTISPSWPGAPLPKGASALLSSCTPMPICTASQVPPMVGRDLHLF